MSAPRPVSVRGGSAGIEADCDDMTGLAAHLGAAARASAGQAIVLHAYLAHPAVIAGALLDPGGAARFGAELMEALDGPDGLAWRAAELELLDAALRAAAAAYSGADAVQARLWPALDGLVRVGPAALHALPALVRGHPGRAADLFVVHDPELADTVIDVVTAFWTNPVFTRAVAVWPDGRPAVSALGPAAAVPAPRDLSDLLSALARRNRGRGGDIDVRILDDGPAVAVPAATPGRRQVIVDIPGTKNWNPSPRTRDVTSAGTNLRAVAGHGTSYESGVLEALRRAGVTADDDVLLVGHSQGGMVAVNAAARVARTGEFRISHVICAGSPIARLSLPDSTQVLALENESDVVPHSDGADNPDRRNLTTVTVHRGHADVLANHSLDQAYVPAATDVQASGAPSVRDYLAGLRPFLDHPGATEQVFHIERR